MAEIDIFRNAEQALRMAAEAPIIAYDTETSGLDWKRNYPIGYVIGTNASDMVYVPVRHGGGGNLPDPDTGSLPEATSPYKPSAWERAFAKALASNPKQLRVGHHMLFDVNMSANVGIKLGRNLACTQNNEALLNEYARSFSLADCAEAHGVTAKKGEEVYEHLAKLFGGVAHKSQMEHYWRVAGDDPIAYDYAVGDGITTMELYLAQMEQIREQNLDVVYDMESKLIWTLHRMNRRGIKVDEAYLHDLKNTLERKVEEALAALPPGFNPRSSNCVRDYVTAAGRTDWPVTAIGNPSFDEKWLKTFPEGRNIITLRKYTNLVNSFINPLINDHVFNGRVHATLNQLKADDSGTISGRFSCSFPNLQQIPKRDKELAPMFRKAFIADDGMLLYEGDQSQAEPRLFAHYSEDPNLLKGYNSKPFVDMHSVTAQLLDVERDPKAKRMNMGLLTGMFPKTFAGHMGVDIETATEWRNQWMKAYPGIEGFQNLASRVIRDRGYVRSLLGRRGRLEHPRFAYRAVSKIIQGGNADIIKWMILHLDMWLEEMDDVVQLLMTVHDSLLWQAPDSPLGVEISEELVRRMEDVQSPPFNLKVPFVIEWDSGRNWKEATFGAD